MSESSKSRAAAAFHAAFPYTIPIFAGFWFLGLTYGVFMNVSGFSFWYPLLIAAVVFGGSLEFVIVTMLQAPFAPVQSFIMALLIQARHLFYGLSMLEKYKGLGWKKPFVIFWMCDETFSINCTADIPPDIDRGWFYFFVSMLDYAYWVSGSFMGGLLGTMVKFNIAGLEFCMTGMFVVIFLEQWFKEKSKFTSLLGLGAAALCLYVFGPQNFMIPAMILILAVLTVLRGPVAKAGDYR